MNVHALFHDFLKFDIQSFRDYINQLDDSFTPFFKELEKRFKELQAIPDNDPIKQTEDDEGSYFDHLIDETVNSHYEHNQFLQRYRYSVIIQLYIFLETELVKIAFTKSEKINGNFIDACKEKLKSKCHVLKYGYRFKIDLRF